MKTKAQKQERLNKAVEVVLEIASHQRIVSAAAGNRIDAGFRADVVAEGLGIAPDAIRSDSTCQGIVSFISDEHIVKVAADQGVVTSFAKQAVVAQAAIQHVVSEIAFKTIVFCIAGQIDADRGVLNQGAFDIGGVLRGCGVSCAACSAAAKERMTVAAL